MKKYTVMLQFPDAELFFIAELVLSQFTVPIGFPSLMG